MVTIEDTAPPSLIVPADILTEATAISSVVDIGTATSSDLFPVTITNNEPATFPIGATTVTWTATDDNGNSTSATQLVTIVDTTAPDVVAQDDIIVLLDDATGSIVNYVVTATDIADPNPVVTCVPASGSILFQPGTTTVTCTAIDNSGNTSAESTFTVTVELVEGGISTKRSVKSGAVAPINWTWEDADRNVIDVGIDNHDIEARAGTCSMPTGEDVLNEDPGTSSFILLEGNINHYNWQTVDDEGGLTPGPYCVRVILMTTLQIQETDITIRK